MKTSRLLFPVFATLLAACASTPPAPPAAPNPSVDEIVASNIAARGGLEKIVALKSVRESGTMRASGGRFAPIVRERKRGGLFRLEFSYQGTTSVFAHDGKSGWQVAPLQGQFDPKLMPPEADAAGGADQLDIEGSLVNWREKGHMVELVGRERLPGGDAFKLKVTLRGGAVRWDYVDVATRLVVRTDGTRLVKGRPTLLENSFSDFRKVGGLVYPFHIESHVKDRPESMRIDVEKVELNPELDDARFRFPG